MHDRELVSTHFEILSTVDKILNTKKTVKMNREERALVSDFINYFFIR